MRLLLDSLNLRALAYLLYLLFFLNGPLAIVKGVQLEWLDQLLRKEVFIFVTVKRGFAAYDKI